MVYIKYAKAWKVGFGFFFLLYILLIVFSLCHIL